jgi:hypothetical protein
MAGEPVPDVVRDIEGVTEADVRKIRAAATTMTALAELEATGAILPTGSPAYEHSGWHVPFSQGGYATASTSMACSRIEWQPADWNTVARCINSLGCDRDAAPRAARSLWEH